MRATAPNALGRIVGLSLVCGIGLSGPATSAARDPDVAARSPPTYEIIDLGDFGGELAMAMDINDAGHVVGRAENQHRVSLPFVWRGGALEYLGSLAGSGITFEGWGMSIADNGLIGGMSLAPAGGGMEGRPFVWSPAEGMREVRASNGAVQGINSAGQAVGYTSNIGAFVWRAQGGIVPIRLPDGMAELSSEARRINEAGVVVGEQYRGNVLTAWKYDSISGVIAALPTLGGTSRAYAINGPGDVVGSSLRPNNQKRPVLWARDGQVIDLGQLPVPGYDFGHATAINDRGWIVGSDEYVGNGRWPKAWLWIGGVKTELRVLIADPVQRAAWPELPWVTAINNRGEIVGQGEHGGIPGRAFLMRPLHNAIFADGFDLP